LDFSAAKKLGGRLPVGVMGFGKGSYDMPTKKSGSNDTQKTGRQTKAKATTTRSRKSAAAGPTAPKTARRPRAAAPVAAAPVATAAASLSPERRHQMIEVAAYYLAESRGFVPGREMDDWLSAERAIDQQPVR
jgi:hypothetical protein